MELIKKKRNIAMIDEIETEKQKLLSKQLVTHDITYIIISIFLKLKKN